MWRVRTVRTRKKHKKSGIPLVALISGRLKFRVVLRSKLADAREKEANYVETQTCVIFRMILQFLGT